mmetsp:Transcript_70919/g.129785  ORF Transcript_70919/g.129785 Transcript_70919/m.129785 type:complete len:435 (-) Transcript_70919:97-1401(-)
MSYPGYFDDLSAPLLDRRGGQSSARSFGSRIVQLPVKDIAAEAISIFQSKNADGTYPLVLIPDHRSMTSYTLSIPTGCACLLQRFGKDVGIAPPGLHFMPPYYRVAYVVTQQACTYQAPVKECPTADNVRVSVDIVVVFTIRDPIAFVRRLGASRFDLMLSGCIQEGIRFLVRTQTFDTVYFLRGNRADSMITLLNRKFEELGVLFSNVTVRNVVIPAQLAASLENTTELRKAMEKLKREQEFQIGEIRRQSEITLEELKRAIERTIVAENGKKKHALLQREQKKVKAEEERSTALIQADEMTKVQKLEADAELQRVKIEIESYRIEAVSKAQSESGARRVQADIDHQMIVTGAEAEYKQLMGDAKAIELDAVVEAENAKRYVAKRVHTIVMKEREILAEMAASKSIKRLTGRAADDLIEGLTEGRLRGKEEEW